MKRKFDDDCVAMNTRSKKPRLVAAISNNFNKRNIADLVICLDVLEHIEESSDVFINSLSPLLKAGGYLILKAPWRGQMTHIDKAADDFYLNGARRFLLENYNLIYRFGAIDVCSVYKKIK